MRTRLFSTGLVLAGFLSCLPAFAVDRTEESRSLENPPSSGSWILYQAAGEAENRAGAIFQLRDFPFAETRSEGGDAAAPTAATVALPRPDGTVEVFALQAAPTMEPALAERFSKVQTYRGRSLSNPGAHAAIEMYRGQVSGVIFDGARSSIVRPVKRVHTSMARAVSAETRRYEAAWKRDFPREPLSCQVMDPVAFRQAKAAAQPMTMQELIQKASVHDHSEPSAAERASRGDEGVAAGPIAEAANRGDVLYTFRMAVAVTAEWTAFQAVDPGLDPVEQAMAALIIAMNRLNGVWEVEMGVRFLLIANNDELIFTDPATDPYPDPTDREGMLFLHADGLLNDLVGAANYDIGHVLTAARVGGVAFLGVIDDFDLKGCGVSSVATLPDEPGFVDTFLHEVGHQAAASHTWNYFESSPDQRSEDSAYEPGAGREHYVLWRNADGLRYFHTISYRQVDDFINDSLSRRNAQLAQVISPASGLTNRSPNVFAGVSRTIPARTPLVLTAEASDLDGDPLLFTWEQLDLGPAKPVDEPDDGLGPLIRSLPPSLDPVRRIPSLTNLVNEVVLDSVKLPTTVRTLTFNARVRDGNGGVDDDTVAFNVTTNAGPFRVLTPDPAGPTLTLVGGSPLTVRWDPANTNGPEVNTPTVDIYLSTDGIDFDQKIATTANDGAFDLTVPDGINTTAARFMVQAVNNVFFNISEAPIAIFDSTDTDQDGLPDGYEDAFRFNKDDGTDAGLDFDQDGLTNLEEFLATTDPTLADSDGDFLSDGQELNSGASDPLRADTDLDGFFDNFEVSRGSDPRNGGSRPEVPGNRFYVNVAADPVLGGDGSSWANAFVSLQDALLQASAVDEIWVARGTYRPDRGVGVEAGDRTATFQLVSDVAILGGFVGNETAASQRDWVTHQVLLDGDLLGNDNGNINVNEPTRVDNAYTVVTGSGVRSGAILDGFVITGGNADVVSQEESLLAQGRGAGIWVNNAGAPIFRNCLIRDNSAANDGGGIYSIDGSATQFFDTLFLNNFAGRQAGAARAFESRTDFVRCVFAGNVSLGFVGGVNLTGFPDQGSTGVFINCVFAENRALSPNFGVGGLTAIDSLVYLEGVTTLNNDGPEARFFAALGEDTEVRTEIRNSVLWDVETDFPDSPVIDKGAIAFTASGSVAASSAGIVEFGIRSISQAGFADSLQPAGADGRWATADDGLRPANGSFLVDFSPQSLPQNPLSAPQAGGLVNLPALRGSTDLRLADRVQNTRPDAGAYEGPLETTDADGDGLFDALEGSLYGTDPILTDSDGDGVADGAEIALFGTDPQDAMSRSPITRAAVANLSASNEQVISFDFASSPGRIYRVWYALDLNEPFKPADIVRGRANSTSTAVEVVIPNTLISAPQEEPVFEVPKRAFVYVEPVLSIVP